jgi:hypothetical protein
MAGEWAVPGLVAMVGGWVTVAAVELAAVPEAEVGAEVAVAAAASRS